MNQSLEEMLRAYCGAEHRQQEWDEYLPFAEFQYNNGVHAATGFSPFYLNYGQHPHTPASLLAGEPGSSLSIAADAAEFVGKLQEALQTATAAVARAKQRAKAICDRKLLAHPFKAGDLVFVEGLRLSEERRGMKVST